MGSSIKTIRYLYDENGNRKALINHDGGRTTYVYDNVNRLRSVENPQNERTTYSYDGANRRTLKEMANGTRASFAYDADGNRTKLYNMKNDGTVLSSFEYDYDKVGNRTSVLEADGSRVTWSYDHTYQLTGEHRTGTSGFRDTYTYDPAGNRTLKVHDGARTTYSYDAANQLTYSQDVSGRTTYTYDGNGNQEVVRAPNGDRTTYVWDYENRMIGSQQPGGVRNTIAYDANGLRVKLEESTGTKKFLWDDQNYLAETDAANDTQVVYTNEPRLYGNLISQRRGSTSSWYHFDAIGSTRELTNVSAVITDTRLYDAWGVIQSTSGATALALSYVGELGYVLDNAIGELYVRRRSMRPSVARWITPDPHAFIDSLNRYLYVLNSPVVDTDPTGLQIFIGTSPIETFCPKPKVGGIWTPPWGPGPLDAGPIVIPLPPMPAPGVDPIPLPKIKFPDGDIIPRIKSDRKSRGCPREGDYECHHLIPEGVFDIPDFLPASGRHECDNLCCIPVKSHNVTRGRGGGLYNPMVDVLIIDNCGNPPSELCLKAIREALRALLECCDVCLCGGRHCPKCCPPKIPPPMILDPDTSVWDLMTCTCRPESGSA